MLCDHTIVRTEFVHGAPKIPVTCLSAAARQRILSCKAEPLFYSDWLRTVFIHYEVDAEALQRDVPFELDLREGRAYVSLVAFTMHGMRPRFGGQLGALLFKPIATHEFLNVRAYVTHDGEPGIFFLAEWLSNRLSVHLGPTAFGLPYRHGELRYDHDHEHGSLHGVVVSKGSREAKLEYDAPIEPKAEFGPCMAGTLDEFLVERYTAFTDRRAAKQAKRRAGRPASSQRYFRIWHPPWPQTPIELSVTDTSLLTNTWPWFNKARFVGANYSPGITKVWMGRPHRVR